MSSNMKTKQSRGFCSHHSCYQPLAEGMSKCHLHSKPRPPCKGCGVVFEHEDLGKLYCTVKCWRAHRTASRMANLFRGKMSATDARRSKFRTGASGMAPDIDLCGCSNCTTGRAATAARLAALPPLTRAQKDARAAKIRKAMREQSAGVWR